MEAVFAQARDAETVSEELLVDDGWHRVQLEPETVVVEVNWNGTEAAFETAVVSGDQDGIPETQRSLFS